MNALLAPLARRLMSAWNAWDQFWFAPRDARTLSALRLLSGAMLFYTHLVWGWAFAEFFGPSGWQDPLLVQTRHEGIDAWSFWWSVPPEWASTVHLACLAVLALYALGAATRLTSILALIITISYVHRAPMASFGLDQINAFTCLYLCLAPCGTYYSVDALFRRWRGTERVERARLPAAATNVATRLIQLHLAILYLSAGLAKLKGETWWTGDAIWLCAANLEYQSGSLVWLAWHPRIVNLLTQMTIAWELSFLFLIWNPTLRPLMLLVGTAIHLGIGMFLGMWTFGLAMIFAYLAFVPPEFFRSVERLFSSGRAARSSSVPRPEDDPPAADMRIPAVVKLVAVPASAAPVEV